MIYFVTRYGRYISPVIQAKPSTDKSALAVSTVASARGDSYEMYIGNTLYLRTSLLDLFVKDRVSRLDYNKFKKALEYLWRIHYAGMGFMMIKTI